MEGVCWCIKSAARSQGENKRRKGLLSRMLRTFFFYVLSLSGPSPLSDSGAKKRHELPIALQKDRQSKAVNCGARNLS